MEKRKSSKYYGVNLIGERHGKLEVIRKADHGKSWWICKCDCGNVVELPTYRFFKNQSCGCFEKENLERIGKNNRTHGRTESRLYHTWCKMKERCYNPNIEHYPQYGGRGITICDEWRNSFESFQEWAYSAGYDDNSTGNEQSLDRINVNGNYEPSNCRWITHQEQMRNTRRTVYVEYQGEKIPLIVFCKQHGITYEHFVLRHLERGFTIDELLRIWKFRQGNHDGYYSMQEAEEHYGVSCQSIMKWIKTGKLKAEKVGTSWFIPCGQEVYRRADRDNNGRFLPGISRPLGI